MDRDWVRPVIRECAQFPNGELRRLGRHRHASYHLVTQDLSPRIQGRRAVRAEALEANRADLRVMSLASVVRLDADAR